MNYQLLAQIDFNNLREIFVPSGRSKINLSQPNLTLGGIISALLPYVFVIAGLILFGMLIFAGFQLLTSGGDPEKTKGARGKITAAFIGFLIIFLAYWIAQIIEAILGIQIF